MTGVQTCALPILSMAAGDRADTHRYLAIIGRIGVGEITDACVHDAVQRDRALRESGLGSHGDKCAADYANYAGSFLHRVSPPIDLLGNYWRM